MLRTFVAIAMPEPVREQLSWICGGIPGARWLDEDDLHLTLRFVGEIEGHVFAELADALSELTLPAFDLTLAGVGHFPPRREPKALWVGAERSEPLVRLRDRIDRVVTAVTEAPERRKFHPHVTIARLSGAPEPRLVRFLTDNALFRCEPFTVDAFHLFSSQLHAKGAQYTLEETFPLERP